jgi:hypothetical protein
VCGGGGGGYMAVGATNLHPTQCVCRRGGKHGRPLLCRCLCCWSWPRCWCVCRVSGLGWQVCDSSGTPFASLQHSRSAAIIKDTAALCCLSGQQIRECEGATGTTSTRILATTERRRRTHSSSRCSCINPAAVGVAAAAPTTVRSVHDHKSCTDGGQLAVRVYAQHASCEDGLACSTPAACIDCSQQLCHHHSRDDAENVRGWRWKRNIRNTCAPHTQHTCVESTAPPPST